MCRQGSCPPGPADRRGPLTNPTDVVACVRGTPEPVRGQHRGPRPGRVNLQGSVHFPTLSGALETDLGQGGPSLRPTLGWGSFPQPRVTSGVQGLGGVPSGAGGTPSAQLTRPAVWPRAVGSAGTVVTMSSGGRAAGPLCLESGSRGPAHFRTDSRWSSPGGGSWRTSLRPSPGR